MSACGLPLSLPLVAVAAAGSIARTLWQRLKPSTRERVRRENPARRELGYDLGWGLVKNFIEQSTYHTVEQLQSFIEHPLPSPPWVRRTKLIVTSSHLGQAADLIRKAFGEEELRAVVGGATWWTWRPPLRSWSWLWGRKALGPDEEWGLEAEWLEVRGESDWKRGKGPRRVVVFFHGGGYFFGSLASHRPLLSHLSRHSGSHVLAPAYRLAPQFPFPCALQDCLATYLWLLNQGWKPEEIVLGGDSAGGGLALGVLAILRDCGMAMPSGAILISPWVDLTHSFPSVLTNTATDIIPSYGFLYRPSAAWPPPKKVSPAPSPEPSAGPASTRDTVTGTPTGTTDPHKDGSSTYFPDARGAGVAETGTAGADRGCSYEDDRVEARLWYNGKRVDDQLQLYAANNQLAYPFVSPVVMPSLGGLCPLLVIASDGECLRDEIIYIAHRAAHPQEYPLSERLRARNPARWEKSKGQPPTPVHLQVYDSTCHMMPVLEWTRPAKACYASMSSFIERVTGQDPRIPDPIERLNAAPLRPGDLEEPPVASDRVSVFSQRHQVQFEGHMIRERVSVYGVISALEPPSHLPALQVPPEDVGDLSSGPIERFVQGQQRAIRRFGKRSLERVEARRQKKQEAAEESGLAEAWRAALGGERPPASACAGRLDTAAAQKLARAVLDRRAAAAADWV